MSDSLLKSEDKRVVRELRTVGLRLRSVYDLVHTRDAYPEAIPLLVELLPTVKEPRIKEGVIRALTVKESRGLAEPALIASLRSDDAVSTACRWEAANALWSIAGHKYDEEMIHLAQLDKLGSARQPILWALGRMKDKRRQIIPLLIRLLEDEQLVAHALIALRKLRAREAVSWIRPLLKNPNAFVRREAKKALDACVSTRTAKRAGVQSAKARTKKQAVTSSGRKVVAKKKTGKKVKRGAFGRSAS